VGVARPGVIAGFVVAPFVCAWLARALQLAPASEA
jgi:thiol:disulfide interchange protein